MSEKNICELNHFYSRGGNIGWKRLIVRQPIPLNRGWHSISPSFLAYEKFIEGSKYEYEFLWHEFDNKKTLRHWSCVFVKPDGQLTELDKCQSDGDECVYNIFRDVCKKENDKIQKWKINVKSFLI